MKSKVYGVWISNLTPHYKMNKRNARKLEDPGVPQMEPHIKKEYQILGTGEETQRLRVLAAFLEDMGFHNQHKHSSLQPSVTPVPGGNCCDETP